MGCIKKCHTFLIVKIALAAVLISLLLSSGQLDFWSISAVFKSLNFFIPALACLFFGIVISGLRWWLLVRAAGNNISLAVVINLQLIDSFFSTWLPGTAGWDAVKGVQIFRLLESGSSTALLSIVTDRVSAMIGLVSIAAMLTFFVKADPAHSIDVLKCIRLLKLLVCISVAGVMLAMLGFFFSLRFSVIDYFPDKVRHYLHFFGVTILTCFRAWPTLIVCWGLSVLATGVVIVGMVMIASIFSFSANPQVTAMAVVFGNLFAVIPITFGGLGVGESVFSRVCVELSVCVASFATIYLVFRVGVFVVNIFRMIVSMFYSSAKLYKKDEFAVMNSACVIFNVGQGQGGNSYEFSSRGKSCVW